MRKIFLSFLTVALLGMGVVLSTPAKAPAQAEDIRVAEDLGLSEAGDAPRPKSLWFETEQAIHGDMLKYGSFDTLVVPFEVQGFAIDRASRSLITRCLLNRLQTAGRRAPDPALAQRALGAGKRRFDDDVYRLANELKVATLIRGFVGHDMEQRMTLSIMVQTREADGGLDARTKATMLQWKDIPFSDEHPPSEAFKEIIEDVVSRLPFKVPERPKTIKHEEAKKLSLPSDAADLFRKHAASHVINAYYLQLIGSLHPSDTIEKEQLFERSLLALEDVSEQSPDWRLLKARALFYLHRRPAALAVIGNPRNAQEKALLALMDGNAAELKRLVNEIESPLPRLMSSIESNDLSYAYGLKKTGADAEKLAKEHPSLSAEILLRFSSPDPWNRQSNILVKRMLDHAFPIEGFTAEGILKRAAALGEPLASNDNVAFSVYNHRKRLLEKEAKRFCCDTDSSVLSERDYLDLLYAFGEHNLVKEIRFLSDVQARGEQAIEALNRYMVIYRDHPEFAYLRGAALKGVLSGKEGQVKENYIKEINESGYNAFYWSGGQTPTSHAVRRLLLGPQFPKDKRFSLFDGDYPRRPYWTSAGPSYGDRKEFKGGVTERLATRLSAYNKDFFRQLEVSLLYSHDNPYPLTTLYDRLIEINATGEASALISSNSHRFIGHPLMMSRSLSESARRGDLDAAIVLYEEAISKNPYNFKPYRAFGGLYIREGDFKKALDVFLSFPGFKESKGFDRVGLSNDAMDAAGALFLAGAANEAAPLLRLSAGYDTGSSSEMLSQALLHTIERDYASAARQYYLRASRYKNTLAAHQIYITFLHLLGHHEEAWAIFDTLDINHYPDLLRSAVVGQRIEGRSNEEIRGWLKEGNRKSIAPAYIDRHIFHTHAIDRPPAPDVPRLMDEDMAGFHGGPDIFKSQYAWFAQGYYHLKKKEFREAYGTFEKRLSVFNGDLQLYRYSMPYIAWAAVKNGKTDDFTEVLDSSEKRFGRDFNFHLSRAFIHGAEKDHDKAIAHINKARFNITDYAGSNELLPWYQLMEAAEWLYEDTGHKGYKDLVLHVSTLHQQLFPMHSWAYAAEAKYAGSENARLRALAMTLYLDRYSERISGFSEEDKSKALHWLEKNNPFKDGAGKDKIL